MGDYKETISELFKQTSFPANPKHCAHNLLDNKKIIIYGAGDGFITFNVFVLKRYGFNVSIVLDRKFKCGDNFFGVPAFSPFEYKPTDEEKENAVVVVNVGKKQYHKEIFKCLRNLGFKNVLLSTDIYEYHLLHVPKELTEKGFSYYLDNKEKITRCFNLFSDDLSREIFTRCIQTHMQRVPIHIPNCPPEEQYFPKDINLNKGYSRFINCGAYNGDTIMKLNKLFGRVDAIACFEPDLENFELLTNYLSAKNNELAESIIVFPCGVLNKVTQLRFAGENKINSMISDKGESIIQCVSLDDVIPGFKPTFITMDVEGVELEALKGAERLIKESRPDLAMSVYHTPNHIWDIPLYINSLNLGYKFYLRNYTSFISETVLYATT